GAPRTAPPPADWPAQVLRFWFDEHGMGDWFGGGPAFDAALAPFADWRDALRGLPVDAFLADAQTALAAIILFDQVPRNRHRGQAEAFATDDLARALARAIHAAQWDDGMTQDQRAFAYLPFEHSEDMDDQRESLRLFTAMGNAEYTRYAQSHFDVIKQFGRFPHRNAALGRADRDGEAAAIAAGAAW
ncbi:MAG: DUF924 family protein, partial [Sphingopyxis sp.]